MHSTFDDETLVAYLDGELASPQRDKLEAALQVDPVLRQRLSALRTCWDLLADLPNVTPRADLMQSTIENVALVLEQPTASMGRRNQTRRLTWIALAGIIMALLGAAGSRALTDFMTRQILVNLPVIVDFPALRNIGSPEYLQELMKIEELVAAAGPGAQRTIGDGRVPAPLALRRGWVEQLQEDSRGKLESNLIEYRPLSDEEKSRLESVYQAAQSDPNRADDALQVIRAYAVILDRWGTKPRALLQDMSLHERVAAVRSQVAVLMALNYVPSDDDREAFRSWLDALVQKQDAPEQLFYYYYDAQKVVDELLWGDPENSIVTRDDIDELLQQRLDSTVAKRLLAITDEFAQRYHLGLWIAPMLTTTSERTLTRSEDLKLRFNQLDPRRQNVLEFLPEDEVRKRLREPLETPPTPQLP